MRRFFYLAGPQQRGSASHRDTGVEKKNDFAGHARAMAFVVLAARRGLPVRMPFASVAALVRRLWVPSDHDQLAVAEQRLLEKTLTTPFTAGPVEIGGGHQLHTVTVKRAGATGARGTASASPIVMMHGFGASAAWWHLNFDSLAQHFSSVLAVDWLGHGRSSRPAFTAADHAQAEAFFVDSLEAWRERVGLERMVLLGHSFGGYMVAAYALKHPHRVERLILCSP